RLFAGRWGRADAIRFHASEKMFLLAHDRAGYDELGRLVAHVAEYSRADFARRYTARYLATLARVATPRRHADVLPHIAGHFKKRLSAADRAELSRSIDDYRRGMVPLVVPITLIRHHVRAQSIDWLASQIYLEPSAAELMLRNHV